MNTDKKQKRKELLIYALATVVGLIGFYIILSPYFKSSAPTDDTGIETDFPEASVVPLVSDKVEIYKRDPHEVAVASPEEQIEEDILQKEQEITQITQSAITSAGGNWNQNATLEEELQSYYMSEEEWRQEYEYNQHLYKLQDKIEALEAQLQSKNEEEEKLNSQLAILERTYELQHKYSPEAQQAERQRELERHQLALDEANYAKQFESRDKNLKTTSVVVDSKSVVSTLQPTLSDSTFVALVLEGNENLLGFNTIADPVESGILRNAFRVRVDETQVLRVGDNLVLRTMEPIRLSNGVLIPRNTPLIATTSLGGNRMQISVDAIEYQGSIWGVKWVGYDISGQAGVYIPWSDEGAALQEFGAGVASSSGSSISFNHSSAKDQIIADVARGLIRGGANYLSNKVNEVKVTFNAGYQLYLMDVSNVQRL